MRILVSLLTTHAVTLMAVPSRAQQETDVPDSPSATTTIPGEQIPVPPSKFGGFIRDTAVHSQPYWPARIVPKIMLTIDRPKLTPEDIQKLKDAATSLS